MVRNGALNHHDGRTTALFNPTFTHCLYRHMHNTECVKSIQPIKPNPPFTLPLQIKDDFDTLIHEPKC